jgi:uncharacterized protein (TIGR03435 family)
MSVCAAVQAQTPAALPRFEVASVKPSVAMGQAAEERDAGWGDVTHRVNLISIPLKFVMLRVFDIRDYELSGPDWLGTERFDIQAIVPAGAPNEQVPLMFQNLLAERFKLKYHRDKMTAPGYALTVAEGGATLTETEPGSGEVRPFKMTDRGGEKEKISGGMKGPYGVYNLTSGNGVLRYEFASITMKNLASLLSSVLGSVPMVDETGLTKSYQLPLDVAFSEMSGMSNRTGAVAPDSAGQATASEPAGTSLRGSLKKLGLKLVRRNLTVERLVVDTIERTPTPN